jgi:hypothetical protein
MYFPISFLRFRAIGCSSFPAHFVTNTICTPCCTITRLFSLLRLDLLRHRQGADLVRDLPDQRKGVYIGPFN